MWDSAIQSSKHFKKRINIMILQAAYDCPKVSFTTATPFHHYRTTQTHQSHSFSNRSNLLFFCCKFCWFVTTVPEHMNFRWRRGTVKFPHFQKLMAARNLVAPKLMKVWKWNFRRPNLIFYRIFFHFLVSNVSLSQIYLILLTIES